MGKARDAFGLVHGALDRRVRLGLYDPGEPLSIGDLAERFRTSATPVREALARLSGAGLVEEARPRGYAFLRLDRSRLDDLTATWRVFLDHALVRAEDISAPPIRGLQLRVGARRAMREEGAVSASALLFAELQALDRNRVSARMQDLVQARLGLVLKAQAELAPEAMEAAEDVIAGALQEGTWPDARVGVATYCDVIGDLAPAIIDLLSKPEDQRNTPI